MILIRYLVSALIVTFLALGCSQQSYDLAMTSPISAAEESISFCPASEKTPDKLIIDANVNADDSYVDTNRELKDLGTEFVVNEFFQSKRSLFNFIKLVYLTIDSEIQKYRAHHNLDERAIFLIFKGGNVLRIVANQILSMLPADAKNLLEESFPGIFKRSDADFSVIVDPNRLNGLDYETTLSRISELAFKALNKIRAEFTNNPQRYFNFMRVSKNIAAKELEQYLEKLKSLPAISDPTNPNWYQTKFSQLQLLGKRANQTNFKCQYEGQYDYLYVNDPKNPGQIMGIPFSKRPHWIMNSINKTLEWQVSPEKTVKFYLVRAKVQFEYTYLKDNDWHRQPIGGELIDISFPHKKDFRLNTFLKHYDDWLADYRLTLNETNEQVLVKAESVAGLAADIKDVIFEQFDRPWNDPKYQKRMNRLIFLSVADLFNSNGPGSKVAKEYLSEIMEKVITPLKDLFPLTEEKSKLLTQQIAQEIDRIAMNYIEFPLSNQTWQAIAHLIERGLIQNPASDDAARFSEFMALVGKNTNILLKLTDMNIDGININEIYKANMESFF